MWQRNYWRNLWMKIVFWTWIAVSVSVASVVVDPAKALRLFLFANNTSLIQQWAEVAGITAISVIATVVLLRMMIRTLLSKHTHSKNLFVRLLSLFEGKKQTLASSRWGDIKKDYKGILGDDGLQISRNFRLSAQKSYEHVAIVGPTGSGKSTNFFIPNILLLPDNASIVVSDPKGEIFEKTAKEMLKRGKQVYVFAPLRKDTMRYNPLAYCHSMSDCRELADYMIKSNLQGEKDGDVWTNSAKALLASALNVVRMYGEEKTISEALDLLMTADEDEATDKDGKDKDGKNTKKLSAPDVLKEIMRKAGTETYRTFLAAYQSAGSERTWSSMMFTLGTAMEAYTDTTIVRATSKNEIDFRELRKRPAVLYVVIPEIATQFCAPLTAPFYMQLFRTLLQHNGLPVYVMLDEFANIAYLEQIPALLATVRSRKISISLGLQSIHQLEDRYGRNKAKVILDNCKTKALLPGASQETAEWFSRALGHIEIEVESESRHQSGTSVSQSKQRRELMTADELRRLSNEKGKEEIVIICDNRLPFKDYQNRYYNDKRLEAMTEQTLDLDKFLAEWRQKHPLQVAE